MTPGSPDTAPAVVVPALVTVQQRWGLSGAQMSGLLGISDSDWETWNTTPPARLGTETMTRTSLILGIYRALHTLHQGPLADQWMTRPNTNPLFHTRTPVDAIIEDGVPTLAATRGLLDARAS